MSSNVNLSTVKLYNGDSIQVPSNEVKKVKEQSDLLKKDSTSAKAHVTFAKFLEENEIKDQAAKEYILAGKIYEDRSQSYKEAYHCFCKALTLNPYKVDQTILDPLIQLSNLCKKLDFKDRSAIHFLMIGGVRCFFNGNYDQAFHYLNEAIQLKPLKNQILDGHFFFALPILAGSTLISPLPTDKIERIKDIIALLNTASEEFEGKGSAWINLLVGLCYAFTQQPSLAKPALLNCIWMDLDRDSIKDRDYELTLFSLKLLQELGYEKEVSIISIFLGQISFYHHPDDPDFVSFLKEMRQELEVESEEEQDYLKESQINTCDDLLALHKLPLALLYKACLLAKKEGHVHNSTFNQYLELLPKTHPDRKRSLLVTTAKGSQSSDKIALLKNVLITAVDAKIPWGQLQSHVNSKLRKTKEFRRLYAYFYKYRVSDTETKKMGESDHLLFFSLFYVPPLTFQTMLKACSESLLSIRDSDRNTVVHIAAFYGLHEQVRFILAKAQSIGELSKLINARNWLGTNPLGMLFLNDKLTEDDIEKTAQLFIREPSFQINSYLNNKIGMDYNGLDFLKEIGGLTCLHVCLQRKLEKVLELLKNRNSWLPVSASPDHFVNMAFPSLNPDHHMHSPELFISDDEPTLRAFLDERFEEIEEEDSGDISGDSSDEETSSFQYKSALQDLASILNQPQDEEMSPSLDLLNRNPEDEPLNLEEEQATLDVIHFHGVPFMKGQYTNLERRFVGRQIRKMNQPLVKPSNDNSIEEESELLRAIHSRTSTATAGFRTLYDIMQASIDELKKLKSIDEHLRSEMAWSWIKNEEYFLDALKKYIYDFASNPIKSFWKKFPQDHFEDVVRYRFPICSLSKAPDHAIKFGVGEGVEEKNREKRMDPIYNDKGNPRHRLAGLLYVTSHTYAEMHQLQSRLAFADTTQLRSSEQMTSGAPRMDHQLEISFFGGVSGKYIKMVVPLVYPNLSKKFKKGYHDVIWGLKEKDLNKNEWNLIDLKHAFTNFTLKVVKALADSQSRVLCSLDEKNQIKLFSTDLKSQKKALSPAQKEIRQGNVSLKGKSSLTKTTAEQLNKPTLSKELAVTQSLKQEIDDKVKQLNKLRLDERMEESDS